MPVLEIVVEGRRVLAQDIAPASNLLDLLHRYDAAPEVGCDRSGRCGRCRVMAWGGLSPVTAEENEMLGTQALGEGWRLACQTRVIDDARVILSQSGVMPVMTQGIHQETARQKMCNPAKVYVAIDLGTTTLAVQMIDGQTGAIIATGGLLNPQTAIGPDVISRIAYAEQPGGQAQLTKMIRTGVSHLVTTLLEEESISNAAVESIVCVGNSVMDHLFLGLSPQSLGTAPFRPLRTEAVHLNAEAVGLPFLANASVYLPPLIAGFVGSDAVAAALACGVMNGEGAKVLMDLGTNGEMFLRNQAGVWCCSTAAGPAFEGGGIRDGMRAAAGALVDWQLDGEAIIYKTVQDVPARGIAGSCLLQIAAALRRNHVLRADGRFSDSNEWPEFLRQRYRHEKDQDTIQVVPGASLYITQHDIRELQLAKGAIWAAIKGMFRASGTKPEQVEEVFLAGALGSHIRPEDLVSLGVVPEVLGDKIRPAGNAAIAGANRMLVQPKLRRKVEEWVKTVVHLDLARDPKFEEDFLSGMPLMSAE